MQRFDGPDPEALVGPEKVADAEHQHRGRLRQCGLAGGGQGAHRFATRQPLIIVLTTVSSEQMSSRTTM